MIGWRYLIAVLLLGAAAAGGLVLVACGATSDAASVAASNPASSPSPESAPVAAPAALALSRTLAAERSWRYEPAGDVTDGREGASRLLFAHLYRLRDAGGTAVAVFDAEQLYVGAPAEREAARDGETIQGATYRRNAHIYRQSLPLASGCPIVAAWADQEVSGVWPDLPASLPVRDTTYWLVIDGGEVTAMVWQGY
jgi:hypothetical protein